MDATGHQYIRKNKPISSFLSSVDSRFYIDSKLYVYLTRKQEFVERKDNSKKTKRIGERTERRGYGK